MKAVYTLFFVTAALAHWLGSFLTSVVTNTGMNATALHPRQVITTKVALISQEFEANAGSGFDELFYLPLLFLAAYALRNRRRQDNGFRSRLIILNCGVLFFYGYVFHSVLTSYEEYLLTSIAPILKPLSLTGIAMRGVGIAGIVFFIFACVRPKNDSKT